MARITKAFKRVNLKLKTVPHTALSRHIEQLKSEGATRMSIQKYIHSLIVRDMVDKGQLKLKSA